MLKILSPITILILGVLALQPASAADMSVGELTVTSPWARASAGARNGAAFLSVTNSGAQDDRLVKADSPIAKVVDLHTHLEENGVMRMRPVEFVPVPAGGAAELKPGGYHVMFMGLNAPLEQGQTIPVTLTFEHAGTVTLEVPVEKVGAMAPHGMEHMGGGHMGGGHMGGKH